ncbi:MAG: molybdenum cofactor guanylyltransferase [Sphingorhabdus sp.]|nr:molybdenum cofactor guanylyltransferase [Sphingorhabdus sp.]|tara:strand:+ start:219 stop:737 length:519 start_codon:yes stop_codon:yes gene_type:complete
MRLLGAVLAGGRSSRFGSDKAQALLGGRRLIDHVAAALDAETDGLIVVGREDPAYACVPDRPAPGLGPLGGVAGALAAAGERGFDAVLTCPVDVPKPPVDLRGLLAPGPAFLINQPTIGLWPQGLLTGLLAFIEHDAKRSVRGFAQHVGAGPVDAPGPIANINRPEDLIDIS